MTNAIEPLKLVRAKPLIIDRANVDTDQILPARYLITTSRNGMSDLAFRDWRFAENGEVIADHPLNQVKEEDRRLMVVADNFGCGSSREHAPWALYDFGVRVILGHGIADIFKNNCRKNGIAAIEITRDFFELICVNADFEVVVNLSSKSIHLGAMTKREFDMDELSRECLMSGSDQLGLLLASLPDIEAYERTRDLKR